MSTWSLSDYVTILPWLIGGIAGLVVAIVFLKRYPRPAVLVLIAMVLEIANAVRWPLVDMTLRERYRAGTMEDYIRLMEVQAWVGGLMAMATMALVLTAVFTGRSNARAGGFPVRPPQQPHPTRPPPMPPQY